MEQREREDHLDFLGLEDTKENLELLVSQELKEYKDRRGHLEFQELKDQREKGVQREQKANKE